MGEANLIITGGSEAAINEAGIGGFNASKALSTRNAGRPRLHARLTKIVMVLLWRRCRSFNSRGVRHAKKRGAKIYAEVAGGGMSADAYHLKREPIPRGRSFACRALDDAGIKRSGY